MSSVHLTHSAAGAPKPGAATRSCKHLLLHIVPTLHCPFLASVFSALNFLLHILSALIAKASRLEVPSLCYRQLLNFYFLTAAFVFIFLKININLNRESLSTSDSFELGVDGHAQSILLSFFSPSQKYFLLKIGV